VPTNGLFGAMGFVYGCFDAAKASWSDAATLVFMIEVRLPDGKVLRVVAGTTVVEIAAQIGPGLARAALAGRVAGQLVDLRTPLEENVALEIVTARDPDAGQVIRHSAEHVMADAVKRLFPEAQVDVGRKDHAEKFQYDFLMPRSFTAEDIEHIEAEMNKILREKAVFTRRVVSRAEAAELFAAKGEQLKLARLEDIPESAPITLFQHGDFVDLCRGPHVQRSDQIGAVKLLETAGAYWRGDEANPMLQRIYGTAFSERAELDAYLERIEEAKRRDHRRLGAELNLFHIDPISPGSPFYHPKGLVLYNELVAYMRSLYRRHGYQEVMTPQLFHSELFKTSGHYDLFRQDMFLFHGDEGEELAVKPMNCPGHCLFFASRLRSYRELPLRFAEFSRLHRNERSGTLTGLSRVRSMAQDDAHIFCEPEQVEVEAGRFFELVAEVYRDLGLSGVRVSVSTRPDAFKGAPTDWDVAEDVLVRAVKHAGFACGIKPKQAAFYGPKVEFDFDDVLGRAWTLSTLQLDMWMPGNFNLRYVGSDGREHRPAMLHRAVLGSLERFIAIYLEHTAGDFPLWLAPVQVAVLPVADRHADYAQKVCAELRRAELRAEADLRNEKLSFKIREAEKSKLPVMLVVGDQEVTNGTVTPRRRSQAQRASQAEAIDDCIAALREAVEQRVY